MIRRLYWNLEAFVFELYARLITIRLPKHSHTLNAPLIVSLTSYPPRFEKLHLTLKTLLTQSIWPDKIILWVSYEDYEFVPEKVKSIEANFSHFTIKKCGDTKSYKKLIPCLEENPNSYIVTADDDTYYPRTWLETLVKNKHSIESIVAHRTHKIKIKNGKILPYKTWDSYKISEFSEMLFPTGCAGVLYPPNCFHSDVTNKHNFLKLCPTADDIWFFWMAKLKGTNIINTGSNINLVTWRGSHTGGLAEQNVENYKNDFYISELVKKYGNPLL